MRKVYRVGLGMACLLVATVRCSTEDDSGGSITGKTIESRPLTVGAEPQTVSLGVGKKGATVSFPAGVTRSMTPITVNLNDGVKKRGATVGGPVVEIQTAALVSFDAPAKMRQPLPPPPVGKSYVAVSGQKNDGTWAVKRGGVRVVGAGQNTADGGVSGPSDRAGSGGGNIGGAGGGFVVDGGVVAGSTGSGSGRNGGASDTGQPVGGNPNAGEVDAGVMPMGGARTLQQTVTDEVLVTYEIDILGTGYWGIALEDAVTGTEPANMQPSYPFDCPPAAKLVSCGMSFMPANVNPCSSLKEGEAACYQRCFGPATCPEILSLYCGQGVFDPTNTIIACIQQCEAGRPIDPVSTPCDQGNSSYYEFDRCDGKMDCADGADEAGCTSIRVETELYCPDGSRTRDSSGDEQPSGSGTTGGSMAMPVPPSMP